MRVKFEGCVFDDDVLEIHRAGDVVAVEPQVFAVLQHLLVNRDRVVPKTELLDEVWGDQFVSESALTTRIKQARKAVGDDGRTQRIIKTAHGRGYRFIADVTVERSDEPTSADGAPTQTAPQTSLVAPPGPIFGRERDVATVLDRIIDRRMITLVGPGGVGKTHLLRHLGSALQSDFVHGATLVELAPLQTEAALGSAFLESLGASEHAGASATNAAIRFLSGRKLLLLIDNAEHLRKATANFCRAVLRHCPGVTMLVTSRARLNVIGEAVVSIDTLDPDAALALFRDSARNAGAELEATSNELRDLCSRLDGVPLALELIAARTRLISLADLSAGLARHLSSSTGADPSARHESVEAALRWSFDALDPVNRKLLEDLSVFSGSFHLEAVTAVAEHSDAVNGLVELCEQSLLVAMPERTQSRFRLLVPVQLFAASANADLDDARARHGAFYLALAESAAELMESPALDDGLAKLRNEWPNVRSAFEYFFQREDLASTTRLINAVSNYAEIRTLSEVRDWSGQVVELYQRIGVQAGADIIANRARFLSHAGDLVATEKLIASLGDEMTAHVLMGRICHAWYSGDVVAAEGLLDEALEYVVGTGGYYQVAFATLKLFSVAPQGRTAPDVVAQLIQLGQDGGRTVKLFALFARAVEAISAGQLAAAVDIFDRVVIEADELRLPFLAQVFGSYRSLLVSALPDSARAAQAVVESLTRGVETGGWSIVASELSIAAKVLADVGAYETAMRVLGARQSAGYHIPATESVAHLAEASATEALGQKAEGELAIGRGLSLEEAAHQVVETLQAKML